MSHHNYKIGTAEQSITGNMPVDLSDLNDVNITSLSADQVLQYDSSANQWKNETASASGSISYIWIGGGYSDDYDNSPAGTAAISAGDTLYIYSNNAEVNTISSATITKSSNWVESITLPAGKYFLQAQTMLEFSASGYAVYRLQDASGNRIASYGVVGESRGVTYGPSNSLSVGYVDLSASTTIKLVSIANSNVETGQNQGTTPSAYGLIYIEKLS